MLEYRTLRKIRNTASFCDVYYTILFRKVTFTGELWLSQRRGFSLNVLTINTHKGFYGV